MTEERRNFRRYDLSLPLTVRRSDTGKTAEGHTRDLSSRGIYFLAPSEFKSGCRIDMTVSLARSGAGKLGPFVTARGRVLRVEPQSHNNNGDGPVMGVAAVIESYDLVRDGQIAI